MQECRHKFALPIGEWNVSGIKDFHDLFSHRGDFDEPLHGWDMSSALDTQRMFYNATSFNQDLSSWDVSSLVYANQMFALARSFNQYLYSWNVGRVEEMTRMFQGATSFRRHLVGWDTSSVVSMDGMFDGATKVRFRPTQWNVTNLRYHKHAFRNTRLTACQRYATLLQWSVRNQDIDKTSDAIKCAAELAAGVSLVPTVAGGVYTDIEALRDDVQVYCESRARPTPRIQEWNVSQILDFRRLFSGCPGFDESLTAWQISPAAHTEAMFADGSSFAEYTGGWHLVTRSDGTNLNDGNIVTNVNEYISQGESWTGFPSVSGTRCLSATWLSCLRERRVSMKTFPHGTPRP